MTLNCQILPSENQRYVLCRSKDVCVVMHIHGHSMSSLYALRDYDSVLLRTTGYNHKIYRPTMQVCDERGRGACKSQPEFVQNGFKTLFHRMSICCFSDELEMKNG